MTDELAGVDDRDLVRAFGRDPAAVEEFYRRHVRALTTYFARRVGEHEAADLVGATFLAALESAAGFDGRRGKPVAWLYGIAAHVLATRYRRAAAESRALLRLGGRDEPPHDEYGRVDERVDADHRGGPALAEVDSLPPAERDLVGLIVHDDLTVTEAAGVLGIRPGTARMRLARARTRLFHRRREEW